MLIAPSHRSAHLMALGTALFWSLAFVCIREVLEQLKALGASPWEATVALFQARMILTALAYLPHIFINQKQISFLTLDDWKRVCLIILTMSFGYHLPLNMGAQSLPSGFVGLIVATSPIFAALLARVILQEALGFARLSAVVLGLVGVGICLIAQNRLQFDPLILGWASLRDPALVMFSAFDGALFAIVGRRIRREIPVSLKLGLAMLGTVLLALPLWTPHILHLLFQINLRGWFAILYLAIACTYFASLLWYGALKILETVEVTLYLNTTTILALAWGAILFQEQIRPLYGIGVSCVLLAIFFASRKIPKEIEPPPSVS